jgi:fatty acid desaturase
LGADHGIPRLLGAAAIAGGVHSWLMYSLTVYSMHEGAAHGIVFVFGNRRLNQWARFVSGNLCRVAASEPIDYSSNHMSHHAKFGTPDDGELLNFVRPKRYWLTFLPLAAFVNYSDFIAHRPARYTASRLISAALSLAYNVPIALYLNEHFGTLFMVFAMLVVFPHFGFYLDRLRQFTEHNLMPLENRNGSRSFGVGLWGLLVGAGPWGSPCHWEHHLVASLPWYQQLALHRYVVSLLTPRQRDQFLIEPVIGFPRLWWRLWREARAFERKAAVAERAS